MLRAIREIQPRWVVGENVRGLVNWSGGLVFHEVQADLEAEGYEVQPFLLPASGVNAPHERYRIWFVAYTNGKRNTSSGESEETERDRGERIKSEGIGGGGSEWPIGLSGLEGLTTDTERIGSPREEHGEKESGLNTKKNQREWFSNFPTQSPVCIGNDGFPTELDGITFSKWRNESIKAAGNAIVPQVVLQIFKAIEEYETNQ